MLEIARIIAEIVTEEFGVWNNYRRLACFRDGFEAELIDNINQILMP